MKNYQKILFPCAVAFVLSLSAFVSAAEDSTLPLLKEKSSTEANLFSAEGVSVVDHTVTFNTTKTKWSANNGEESQSSTKAEARFTSFTVHNEAVSVESIIASYQ